MSTAWARYAIVGLAWTTFYAPLLAQTTVSGPPAKGDRRTVTVTGAATVHVKPNAARIVFAITNDAVGNPREENDRLVGAAKKQLAELAIASVQVDVVPCSINTVSTTERVAARVAGPGAQPLTTRTKQATTVFVISVRDKDLEALHNKAIRIADAAVASGGTALPDDNRPFRSVGLAGTAETIPGPRIEWLSDSATEGRQQAIRKAVEDAKQNARAAVGDNAFQITSVEIYTPAGNPYPRRTLGTTGAEDGATVAIAIEVRITFAY
jgi:uncharacterized protein YggE